MRVYTKNVHQPRPLALKSWYCKSHIALLVFIQTLVS